MIIYIYDKDWQPITQIFDVVSFQGVRRLNSLDEGTITMSTNSRHINYTNFKEYNKIKIKDDNENLLWSGIIEGLDGDKNETEVALLGFSYLLEKKYLYQDYSFVDETIDNILSTILTNINTRANGYEPEISLDCGIDDITSKDFTEGKTFLSVLEDFVSDGYDFYFDGETLKIKKFIGIDRTDGDNYLELIYDNYYTRRNNINNYRITNTAKNIDNAIISKDINDFYSNEDVESMQEFGRLENSVFSSGDLQKGVDEALKNRKQSLKEIEVTPNTNIEANIGDKVEVRINGGNQIHQIETSMRIKEKEFEYGDLNKEIIKLETNKVKTKEFLERFKTMDKEIKALKNKVI